MESRSGWSQDLRKLVKIFPHGYTTSHLNLKYNIAAHANVEADSLQVTNYTKFSFFLPRFLCLGLRRVPKVSLHSRFHLSALLEQTDGQTTYSSKLQLKD